MSRKRWKIFFLVRVLICFENRKLPVITLCEKPSTRVYVPSWIATQLWTQKLWNLFRSFLGWISTDLVWGFEKSGKPKSNDQYGRHIYIISKSWQNKLSVIPEKIFFIVDKMNYLLVFSIQINQEIRIFFFF